MTHDTFQLLTKTGHNLITKVGLKLYLIERDVVQEVNAILFVTLAIAVAIPGLTSM
jgi:hypothetical protein